MAIHIRTLNRVVAELQARSATTVEIDRNSIKAPLLSTVFHIIPGEELEDQTRGDDSIEVVEMKTLRDNSIDKDAVLRYRFDVTAT